MAGKALNIKVCFPLKLHSVLTVKYHAICHYSYNLPLAIINLDLQDVRKILYSVFLIMFIISCDNSVFDFDENITNVDLYCFPSNLPEEIMGPNKPLLENGFRISNDSLAVGIIRDMQGEEVNMEFVPSSYVLVLAENGKIVLNGHLNHDLSIIMTGHGNYRIGSDYLLSFADNFETLVGYELILDSIHIAHISKKLLIENGAYILIPGVKDQYDWELYSSKVLLKRENLRFAIGEKLDAEGKVTNELRNTFEQFEIESWQMTDDGDSVIITILTNSKPKSLPAEYRQLDFESEFGPISITAYGLDAPQIESIFEEAGVPIKKMNTILD
jgi:hypothetical protein